MTLLLSFATRQPSPGVSSDPATTRLQRRIELIGAGLSLDELYP